MREKILSFLKKHDNFISGEELSRSLDVSRSAVWKCVEELRADGYEIAAIPRHGYRLESAPDRILPAEVQFALGTRKFGCQVEHFESLDSTMNEAFRRAMDGALEGTVIVSETQTKGRGRLGRTWASPRGKGLYFSLILRPRCPVSDAARLTLLSAVALSEAVEKVSGIRPLIKWPNDLLVDGKKLSGILTELRAEIDKVEFVVIGFGVNVNTARTLLPPEAISIKEAGGKVVSRVALLQEILRSLEKRYLALPKEGYGPVLEEWRQRSATLGRTVRFQDKSGQVEGVAEGLSEDGGLLVKMPSGETVKRMAGDILL